MNDSLMDEGLTTDDAWRRFRHELADRMADLHPDALVEVMGESMVNDRGLEFTPCFEFSRDGEIVVGRVSGDCVHAESGVAKKARRHLVTIGWDKHKSPHDLIEFRAEVDVSHVDVLAAMTVAALREVFDVVHPASLSGDVTVDDDDPEFTDGIGGCLTTGPLAVFPTSRHDLDELIDEAVSSVLGYVPVRDEDGDVVVPCGTSVVYVSTLPTASAIRVWALLTWQITDLDRARFEVEVLNRHHPLTRFALVGDRITAEMYLLSPPFVPEHLRETFRLLRELASHIDGDLAVRVSGKCYSDPDSDDGDDSVADVEDETHEESNTSMMILLQLDSGRPRSISPAMAAHICGNDPERLLRLITSAEGQEMQWLNALDEVGDDDESEEVADVYEGERAQAARCVTLLRKALRYVVEREFHRSSA
jgi:T3SS (YopN, CesT) and YbjN peptide-binding chaperone 1/T3SS (YopN, CesT) and YbjN peptide-binding chaperone 3/TY-Chap C-terminal domain